MKLIFSAFDVNEDGFIDEFDIFCVLKQVDFQMLKDTLRKKKDPFATSTERHKAFIKSLLPLDEVDLFLQSSSNRSYHPCMSLLEECVTNDLRRMCHYFSRKLRDFEGSRQNKESIPSRMQ